MSKERLEVDNGVICMLRYGERETSPRGCTYTTKKELGGCATCGFNYSVYMKRVRKINKTDGLEERTEKPEEDPAGKLTKTLEDPRARVYLGAVSWE